MCCIWPATHPLKQPSLPVPPAFLVGLVDLVSGLEMADEERGSGIVVLAVPEHDFPAGVGVAVAAEMAAGIVGAYIAGDVAAACFPGD